MITIQHAKLFISEETASPRTCPNQGLVLVVVWCQAPTITLPSSKGFFRTLKKSGW